MGPSASAVIRTAGGTLLGSVTDRRAVPSSTSLTGSKARPALAARAACRLSHPHGLLVLDELGYLPLAQTGGQPLFNLISRL
jgi:hypothetical protein